MSEGKPLILAGSVTEKEKRGKNLNTSPLGKRERGASRRVESSGALMLASLRDLLLDKGKRSGGARRRNDAEIFVKRRGSVP